LYSPASGRYTIRETRYNSSSSSTLSSTSILVPPRDRTECRYNVTLHFIFASHLYTFAFSYRR
jgi:hypothetical protein